jgi:hypothetical protein
VRRFIVIAAALGLLSLLSFTDGATLPSTAAASTVGSCKVVPIVHHGTHLVDTWRMEVVAKDGKRVKVRVHILRRKVFIVRGHKVTRLVPAQKRVAYTWTTRKRVCTTPKNPSAYLDPTFVQNPSNPLQVTWCASVNDNGAQSPCQDDNGQTAPSTLTNDSTLQPGVLDFDIGPVGTVEGLVCSTNVGPTVDYAICTVNLTSTGEYTMTTQYLSGSVNSTASETVTVPSYSTSTTLSASQLPRPSNSACLAEGSYGGGTEYCDYWTLSGTVSSEHGQISNEPSSYTVSYEGKTLTITPGSATACTLFMSASDQGVTAPNWTGWLESLDCSPTSEVEFSPGADPGTLVGPSVVANYAGSAGYLSSSSAADVLPMAS